ncbi:spore germination protein GerPC [Bacillus thuringiensis]|nr:spore germination protein GerPC [Bacillus thuringiensis]
MDFEEEERRAVDEMYGEMMVDEIKKEMEDGLRYYLSEGE